MANTPFRRKKCDKCHVKIPKTNPKLYCTVCNDTKHLACHKLTKTDAYDILNLKIPWTCSDCILQILPINACSVRKRDKNIVIQKFKVQCSACYGFSYSPKNVKICEFCEKQVHAKCWNNSLGCLKC